MKGRKELLRVGLPLPFDTVQQMIALTCASAPETAEMRIYNGALIVDVPKDEPAEKEAKAKPDEKDRLER